MTMQKTSTVTITITRCDQSMMSTSWNFRFSCSLQPNIFLTASKIESIF